MAVYLVSLGDIINAFATHPSSIYTTVGIIIVILGVLGIGLIWAAHWIAHHKITTAVIVLMILVAWLATCVNHGKTPTQPELQPTPTVSASPR